MRFQYDAYGRKVKAEKFVGNTNIVTRTESWQYNDRGQLIVEYKPEGVIKYEYDSLTGQKTAMMVVKATNENDALERKENRYNELSWLTEVKVVERNDVVLAAPELTRYGFDLQGCQLRIDNPNGTIQRSEVNTMGEVSRMREYGPDSTQRTEVRLPTPQLAPV